MNLIEGSLSIFYSCGWCATGCKACSVIGGVWWVAALLRSPPAAARDVVINVIGVAVVRLIAPCVWPLPFAAEIDGIMVIRRLWLLSPRVKFYCIIFYVFKGRLRNDWQIKYWLNFPLQLTDFKSKNDEKALKIQWWKR